MRHQAKGRQLSRTSTHKRALLRNMATSLILHGGIETTVAKAKELRPYAEKLITLARRGDLHARRQAAQKVRERKALTMLFSDLGPDDRAADAAFAPDSAVFGISAIAIIKDAPFSGACDGLGAIFDAHLLEYLVVVPFDRAKCEVQLIGDFGVGQPFGDQAENLNLAVS